MQHNKGLTAEATIVINAPGEKVWDALTSPEKIKLYLFGTETVTDWKPGSDIRWKGSWQGKAYEDKGRVLSNEPGKFLSYTYWSSMSGKEDREENYYTVSTSLAKSGEGTRLTIRQDGNATEESRRHSQSNWEKVLASLKAVVEQRKNP